MVEMKRNGFALEIHLKTRGKTEKQKEMTCWKYFFVTVVYSNYRLSAVNFETLCHVLVKTPGNACENESLKNLAN
jgi:hypothetical protein